MATVKVKFRPSTVPGRPGSITYQLTHQRTVRLITTPYKIYPHEWDSARSRITQSSDADRTQSLRSIAQKILWDINKLATIIKRHDCDMIPYTVDDLVADYRCEMSQGLFFTYMEGVISRLHHLGKHSLVTTYSSALRSFKKFRNDEDLPIAAITTDLIEEYQAWLTARGVIPNSVSFYMRILRAVYNRAVEEGLLLDSKPFRKAYTGVAKTVKRAIDIADIKRIAAFDLSHRPALQQARDIFMLLFYLRGMSMIDLMFLRKTELRVGILTYRRHKTGQLLTIKWMRQMQEIADKYNDEKSPYLLSFIRPDKGDEIGQYNRILGNTNYNLKKVGQLAGIPIPLTTYVSRHAWASIARSKNIPISVISESMGHDSEKTTQIYLATLDTAAVDQANALIIGDLTTP